MKYVLYLFVLLAGSSGIGAYACETLNKTCSVTKKCCPGYTCASTGPTMLFVPVCMKSASDKHHKH